MSRGGCRGLSGHCGVQLSPQLLAWADVVVAVDQAVLDSLRELADEEAAAALGRRDIPNLWQQPAEAFTPG
ncbi:hypothetical protein GCM10020000_82390 [Streptomyces olivoverticillatus]